MSLSFPAGALEAAAALAPFTAATLHEAYGHRGALSPDLKPIVSGLRVCAPAMTARTPPGDNLVVHQALALTPASWLLAVATDGDRAFGYWGNLMTTSAIARRVAGLVIEGGIRDLAELRASGFPVFTGAVSIRGTTKLEAGDVGGTISLGGVDVSLGDILSGDDDGVVCVRLSDAEWVAQKAAERVAREDQHLTALRKGVSTLEVYGWPPAAERSGT